MRCYKCNSALSDHEYCLKCGADVSVYKVVVKTSNAYYNMGLAKAQVRDLSGAIQALKVSIHVNKKNIKARNLLGLVYFEMGEVAMALSQWVISLNYKPEKNVADVYIRKVKANQNKLESLNQAAKKYNFSLRKAQEEGDDVALIQLKKVISANPKFVKAYLLLALVHMKNGEEEKAAKLLIKVLKIDRNNTLALRYLDEINKTGIAKDAAVDDSYYKGKKRGALSGNDVIIPRNSYREPSSGVLTVIYILLGIVIGIALMWFLIIPSKVQSEQEKNNELIKEYSEKIANSSVEIAELEDKYEEALEELEQAGYKIDSYEEEIALYKALVDASYSYVTNDFKSTAVKLAEVDVTQLPDETSKSLYTILKENSDDDAKAFYMAGVSAYTEEDFVKAISHFTKAYELGGSTVENAYYLAMSYLAINDKTTAQQYIDEVNNKYGNSTYATQLNAYVATLK